MRKHSSAGIGCGRKKHLRAKLKNCKRRSRLGPRRKNLRRSWISTCAGMNVAVCCADERRATRTREWYSGGGASQSGIASGAILSKLFRGIEGESVQVELSGVWILFELLRFLLIVLACGNQRFNHRSE